MDEDDSLRHPPPRGHESRDLSVRVIIGFFVGLTLLLVIMAALMKLTFDVFVARERALDPPPPPLAAARPELPPEPRLQTAPLLDLAEHRAAEDALLHDYGWIDEKAGVVRIPIERAMELIVERGLPARRP